MSRHKRGCLESLAADMAMGTKHPCTLQQSNIAGFSFMYTYIYIYKYVAKFLDSLPMVDFPAKKGPFWYQLRVAIYGYIVE
jgi:hypothetical protein